MYQSTNLHRLTLHFVENDTKAKAFCGPTAIAAVTGKSISIIRDACRMAPHDSNWPARFLRAPNVRGITNRELETVLNTLGYIGRWVEAPGRPTLAAWLDNRNAEQRGNPCIVNVTGHYVAVGGYMFVDTFTKGQVVEIDEAPRRRKRVQRVFIVTGQVAPSAVVSKQPAARVKMANKAPWECARCRDYADFARYARSVGATWHKERGDDELEIRLADGRRLRVVHSVLPDDWGNAQRQLEDFLSTAEPDPDRFEDDGDGEWYALFV